MDLLDRTKCIAAMADRQSRDCSNIRMHGRCSFRSSLTHTSDINYFDMVKTINATRTRFRSPLWPVPRSISFKKQFPPLPNDHSLLLCHCEIIGSACINCSMPMPSNGTDSSFRHEQNKNRHDGFAKLPRFEFDTAARISQVGNS